MKLFPLLAILATSLTLFLSCGQHSDDPELKTQIYIQGTVKDASSGLPIADAEITLSFGGSTLHQGKTDGEGTFSFPISEAGDYKFLVSASGYDDAEKLFPLTDLSKNNVTITMVRSTFLTIKNESTFALEKVTWNGVDFGSMAVNAAPVKKSVKPYNAQITFSVPSKGLNAKINAFLEIKQGDDIAYSISDDVLVTEINGTATGIFDNTTTLRLVEKAEAPQAGTLSVTDISYVSAKLNSSIAKQGNPKFTERGFCYGVTKNPAKGSSTCKKIDDIMQPFSLPISDLTDTTKYYARAYVENEIHPTQYSEEIEFQTLDGTPSVKFDLVVLKIGTPEATLNGTILKPGYPAYTEKGFCYGIATNPSIGNSTCEKADGTASSFSLHISDLAYATSYNVRAYIDNGVHPVQYSNKYTFKTLLSSGPQLVDTRDGKTYRTASFKSYTWMIDDLKYNSSTGVYTWNDAIGICPSGWHLPDDSEWTALSNALGTSAHLYFTDATGFRWWTATEYNSTSARLWHAFYGDLERTNGGYDKSTTYHVRCVMD